MQEPRLYQHLIFDSARWQGFVSRPGDIVICTPPKSGTTWTQMLCALLIFDGPEFPGSLDSISPWLDMQTRSKAEVHQLLAAQTHRRFIKTHTPLDGLALQDDTTYIVVGRDPRDVAVSFGHHMLNLNMEEFLKAREAAVGNHDLDQFPPPPPIPDDPQERLQEFMDGDDIVSLDGVLGHLQEGWKRRDAPNVHLFHYADYQRDLPGNMQRLADFLGLSLTPERARELAAEASLVRMRSRAHEVVPDVEHNHWHDPSKFFRSGGSGEWRAGVSEALLQRYEARAREISRDQAFLDWAHQGAQPLT